MPLIAACQLPAPSNWPDFESLCADLWRAEWNNPTIQRNGRSGQAQNGVDISGLHQGEWIGIQCKCIKAEATLNEQEVLAEVEKAKKFSPKLSHFILATTGLKDVRIESFCRELTEKHLTAEIKLFTVTYLGWQDIGLIMQRQPKVTSIHFPFAISSSTPLILNNEISSDWKQLRFSFTRKDFVNPRIVAELQGFMSDRNHTVISVDLTEANHSNRFYGDYSVHHDGELVRVGYEDGFDGLPSLRKPWFDYEQIAISQSGIHIIWTRDCGGGSGVFHNLLFLVLQKDTGLFQEENELVSRERILLKILGSISLGDRYFGKIEYIDGRLEIGGVDESEVLTPYYARQPFTLFVG